MIVAVFGVMVLTVAIAFLLIMRIQAKLEKMKGGRRQTSHFEFEMGPLPPPAPENAIATLQPISSQDLVDLAARQQRIANEQALPSNPHSVAILHADDRDDEPTLVRKLYALTQYIHTPYSPAQSNAQSTSLLGDLVIINIATEEDYVVPIMQRLLLLNNRQYPRLFFVCRRHDGTLQPFKPFANQLTTFQLPFFKYAPIAEKQDSDPEYSVYFGASNVYEMPALYAEPNDENIIYLKYTTLIE